MISNNLSVNFEKVTGQKFETFYRKYRPKLIWYLTKYTKDPEKSEDFADDAFIQALLKIDNYNSEKSQVHTWIYKIAENLVKKDYKDKKRLYTLSIDNNGGDNLSLINVIPCDNEDNLEKELLLIKKVDMVKESIFKLPEKYKKVMIMRELEKKPYLEISRSCIKDYKLSDIKGKKELPSAPDFLDIFLENKGEKECHIIYTPMENENSKKDLLPIKMRIEPGKTIQLNKDSIGIVSKLEIEANDLIEGIYRTTTNLSTIKSQISKGRQLIQSMVKKNFQSFDDECIN